MPFSGSREPEIGIKSVAVWRLCVFVHWSCSAASSYFVDPEN